MLGVDHGRDRIKHGLGLQHTVEEKCLRHRSRIGESGRLDENAVERRAVLGQQSLNRADKIAAHRAADAAIVHLEQFFLAVHDQIRVDADLAELVDDDGVTLAVVLAEDAVEQGRLAGAEIAGQHGYGNAICHRRRWPGDAAGYIQGISEA
jgi:hypothetical protein